MDLQLIMDLQEAVLQMKIELNYQFQRSPNFNYERGNRDSLLEKIENLKSRSKFTTITCLLSEVYINLTNQQSKTKR